MTDAALPLDGIQIKAATNCRVCGRKLTSRRSIAVGVGCTCRQYIGMDEPTRRRAIRDRVHRRRKKVKKAQMEREIYESLQLKFQWGGTA